jgi:hypothetical protein
MFFDLRDKDTEDRGAPDPTKNQNRISTQFARVKKHLIERVAEWPGFPELHRDNVRIHAYGMGTALSKCLGRGSIFALHNRVLTIRDMDETLARQSRELDTSRQEVRTLFAALKQEQAARGKALSDRLVMLYGLPVYQELLRKFGLDRLRFAGFGLRYGVYFGVGLGLKFDEFLSTAKADDSARRHIGSEPIRIFLSHSSADNELARRISEGLHNAGIGVWLAEAEIRPGESFVAKIAEGLSKSRFVAVIVSKKSHESNWVSQEMNVKLNEQVKTGRVCVLPLLAEDCALPTLLTDSDYIDFRTDHKSGLEDLLAAINQHR